MKKRERFINYLLVVFSLAYAVFVAVYDHYRITVYAEMLERSGEKVGYALGMTIIYVLFNLCVLCGVSLALAIALFVLTKVYFNGKTKRKKGVMIAILVCKCVGCALTIFGAVLAFSYEHSDWLMKLVYAVALTAYLIASVHGFVFFKKTRVNE